MHGTALAIVPTLVLALQPTAMAEDAPEAAPEGRKSASAQPHPVVDLERWLELLTVDRLLTETRERYREWGRGDSEEVTIRDLRVSNLDSPVNLAAVEHIRRAGAMAEQLGEPVPTDYVFFADGEPAAPHLTRRGGVPYRSRSRPWPRSAPDAPMTFIAQFYFGDSRDLLPEELPGDVLLVFGQGEDWYFGLEDPLHARFEWSSLGIPAEELCARDDVPQTAYTAPSAIGYRCRGRDYPDAYDHFMDWHSPYWIATTQATRIGGCTHYIQGEPSGSWRLRGTLDSTTLHGWEGAALRDDQLTYERLRELRKSPPAEAQEEMYADVGCLYFFLDGDGLLRVTWDCY